jgi:hypothetical protein
MFRLKWNAEPANHPRSKKRQCKENDSIGEPVFKPASQLNSQPFPKLDPSKQPGNNAEGYNPERHIRVFPEACRGVSDFLQFS